MIFLFFKTHSNGSSQIQQPYLFNENIEGNGKIQKKVSDYTSSERLAENEKKPFSTSKHCLKRTKKFQVAKIRGGMSSFF